MVLSIIVGFVAFLIGVWGWAQIIGSFQNVSVRGIGMTLFTVILWSLIIIGSWFLMKKIAPDYDVAYYIGLGISLVIILFQGKIE